MDGEDTGATVIGVVHQERRVRRAAPTARRWACVCRVCCAAPRRLIVFWLAQGKTLVKAGGVWQSHRQDGRAGIGSPNAP